MASWKGHIHTWFLSPVGFWLSWQLDSELFMRLFSGCTWATCAHSLMPGLNSRHLRLLRCLYPSVVRWYGLPRVGFRALGGMEMTVQYSESPNLSLWETARQGWFMREPWQSLASWESAPLSLTPLTSLLLILFSLTNVDGMTTTGRIPRTCWAPKDELGTVSPFCLSQCEGCPRMLLFSLSFMLITSITDLTFIVYSIEIQVN